MSSANYHRRLALKAVTDLPTEDILYGIFNEFVTLHQKQHRFAIYPQMSLKWNPDDPQDRRSEVPDFGLGNFTPPGVLPHFKLRCGVEAKRARSIMKSLPKASSIMDSPTVAAIFHILSFQAQNQAKAAYKNSYPLSDAGVDWILLIGPYWLPKKFGPFSEAESTVRAHKKTESTDSADFDETMKLLKLMNGPPPILDELYLLGTKESFTRLEQIIGSTDQLEVAQPFIQAMSADGPDLPEVPIPRPSSPVLAPDSWQELFTFDLTSGDYPFLDLLRVREILERTDRLR